MDSIIEIIWNSNINPHQCELLNTDKTKALLKETEQLCNLLEKELSKEQKELLDKLLDHQASLYDQTEKMIFTYGFKLGAKIIMDISLDK